MKSMKKLLAFALVLVMLTALGATVFAADEVTPATGTIKITPPENATGENTYKIYKVFDATVNATTGAVAYKLLDGCADTDVPAGFTAVRGYITEAPASLNDTASAIAAYTKKELVDTVVTSGTTAKESKSLEPGYYYIETTTGTCVVVQPGGKVEVADKNTIPTVKKSPGAEYDESSLAAIAAVGTDQPYTAVINAGKGAKKVVFTDTMTNQTYNGDAKVYVGGSEVAAGANTFSVTGAAGASTFSITFVDAYIASLAANTEITIKYSGKITSDALSADPATNKATVTSGESNTNSSEEVKVYNAKLTVTKQDGDNNPLADAGFVIKAADGDNSGKYYKLADDKKSITWVESIDDATEYTSNAQGAVTAFTGLGVGKYTLVEKTVPAGYNKAADQDFEIKDKDYTAENLELTATVTNEAGTELPSTGGIGTTLFYVFGGILFLGAAVVLVTRRRVRE